MCAAFLRRYHLCLEAALEGGPGEGAHAVLEVYKDKLIVRGVGIVRERYMSMWSTGLPIGECSCEGVCTGGCAADGDADGAADGAASGGGGGGGGGGDEVVVIRAYESSDRQQVVDIYTAGLMQFAVEGSVVAKMEHAFLKRCLESDMKSITDYYITPQNRTFFVAEVGGKVVGCAAAVSSNGEAESGDAAAPVVELQRMSVSANCRGKGVGGKLVAAVIAFAADVVGATAVKLGTLDRKLDAIRLYERHNFKQVNKFKLPAKTFLDDFGVHTEEVVHVLSYRLELPAV